jgi:pectinesterase
VIFVKAGTYHELLYVQREKHFVVLVGEDPLRTVITYGLKAGDIGPDGKRIGTFRTPTAYIDADDFTAENLTFENAAGPNGQALALRVDGDRVVFRNCRFLGWQDTIFLDRGRQYFEDSLIAGHVDFIFGGATAFFERCRLHALGNGYLTAASTPQDAAYGFVFAHGSITGEPEVKSYLGRPWRAYAAVVFLDTSMSDIVRPEGWHNWDRPERERTTRYGEFGTTGSGARSARRVSWARALSAADAAKVTVGSVLAGTDRWDPRRVPAHPSSSHALDGAVR